MVAIRFFPFLFSMLSNKEGKRNVYKKWWHKFALYSRVCVHCSPCNEPKFLSKLLLMVFVRLSLRSYLEMKSTFFIGQLVSTCFNSATLQFTQLGTSIGASDDLVPR